MDAIDRKLLNELQSGLPLTERPFAALALSTPIAPGLTSKTGKPKSKRPPARYGPVWEGGGISEEEALTRISALMANGTLRKIGPVLDSRALGWVGTLAVMAVPDERIDEVAEIINACDGVTHNYLRESEDAPVPYNMWFTLHARDETRLRETLGEIEKRTALNVTRLDAEKVFKISVGFDMSKNASEQDDEN